MESQNQNTVKPAKPTKKMSLDDFLLLSVIGKGSYAKVVLIKKKDNGKIFALKILKKKYIEKRKQEEHVLTERNVLVGSKHPFIIKLFYTFMNDKKLFFVLEYCPGGELFNLLQKRRQFTEEQTKFYAAQIVLAIEYLHKNDVIYRDLKPENVLIDAEGYIRITDFGLSKQGTKGKDSQSVCGTPEYLAPEVLFKMGHGKAVDWWTLGEYKISYRSLFKLIGKIGAIIYEMLTGLPPFYTANREELFERIKFCSLKYPYSISPQVRSLLEGLFQKNPEKRLGYGPDDAKFIKEHPWFSNVNWSSLLNKEIKPPFVPLIKSEMDITHFDPEFTETPIESMSDGNSLKTESFNNTNSNKYPDFPFNDESSLKKENMEKIETE